MKHERFLQLFATKINETLLIKCSKNESNEDGAKEQDAYTCPDGVLANSEDVQHCQSKSSTDGKTNQSNNTQAQDCSRDLQEFLHSRKMFGE